MFNLFRRRPRRPTPPAPRARLQLEWLESRDVPSTVAILSAIPTGVGRNVTINGTFTPDLSSPGVANQTIDLSGVVSGNAQTDDQGHFARTLTATGPGAVQAWADDGSSNLATALVTAPVPPSVDLTAEAGRSGWVFSGHVTGPNPGSITVVLTGLASVQNIKVSVDANGSYSVPVQLNGTTDDTGTLQAVAVDGWGQRSDPALYPIIQAH